ncbi:MAG TPA: hypothetical protein VK358_15455 [Longimicrobium sp.]|nr:hypothetical protein [Longimicrobium sp.]
MSVEAFLNFYGVVRLGERFYKDNLQKAGATEKLSLLLALCDGVELDPSSDLWRTVRALFDRRNALVHPKTAELGRLLESVSKAKKLPQDPDLLEQGTVAYRRMKTFYRLFPNYASEVGPLGRRRLGVVPDLAWFPDPNAVPPEGF